MGQITNLVSVDAQRLLEATPYLCILWSAPYQVSTIKSPVHLDLENVLIQLLQSFSKMQK